MTETDVVFVTSQLRGRKSSSTPYLKGMVETAGIENYSIYELSDRAHHSGADLSSLKRFIADNDPNLIVLVGGRIYDLFAKKKDLHNWRGSVVQVSCGGWKRKAIGIFSPMEIWKKFVPNKVCTDSDMQRIKEQAKLPTMPIFKDEFVIPKNAEEVRQAYTKILYDAEEGSLLTFDIECQKNNCTNLTCIGFASSKNDAVCFGLKSHMYEDGKAGLDCAIAMCKSLLKSPIRKVAQNGNFDITVLEQCGFPVRNYYFDTMYAHHLLHVELPRSLGFLTSLYTLRPYFKSMVDHVVGGHKHSWSTMAKYNCLDCVTTHEIAEKLIVSVEDMGLTAFYDTHYTQLLKPLLEAQLEGVPIDVRSRDKVRKQLRNEQVKVIEEIKTYMPSGWYTSGQRKEIHERRTKIDDLKRSGKYLKANGEVTSRYLNHVDKLKRLKESIQFNVASPKHVAELLYGELKVKPKTKDKKITTDDDALKKIGSSKFTSDPIKHLVALLLEHRRLNKIIGTYLDYKLSADGRSRCEYKMASTKSGRLSSTGSLDGTGTNHQCIPKRKGMNGLIRSLFKADEGHLFVSADLSQAEARAVAYLSQDEQLIKLFETSPDAFKQIASDAYGVEYGLVTPAQRDKGKVLRHAMNYGQGVGGAAFGAGMTYREAEIFDAGFNKKFPGPVRLQEETKYEVRHKRRLVTPLGRYRDFYGQVVRRYRNRNGTIAETYNSSLLRDAYSYKPQSFVGDLLNEVLVRSYQMVLEEWGVDSTDRPRFRLQIHDQIVYSCPKTSVDKFKAMLHKAFAITTTIHGRDLYIPYDLTEGEDWSTL